MFIRFVNHTFACPPLETMNYEQYQDQQLLISCFGLTPLSHIWHRSNAHIWHRSNSRTLHRLHVFPRLAQVICFPALKTVYTFSRAWHRSYAFPRFAPFTCFPALGTANDAFPLFAPFMHRLSIFFPRLKPGTNSPKPGPVNIFLNEMVGRPCV